MVDNRMEEWRPIPGWESSYEVSSLGRVRSVGRHVETAHGPRHIKGRTLSPYASRTSLRVKLFGGPSPKSANVHRLVLEAFIGPCPQGMEGCHNDGNFRNNQLGNLRWDTAKSNSADRIKHGKNPEVNKTHCPRGHEFIPENLAPWGLRQGCRTCLACARARAYCKKYDAMEMFESIADSRYASILGA